MFPWWEFLAVPWRVGHRFSPYPLPLPPGRRDLRDWMVRVWTPPHFVPVRPFPANQKLRVSLHRILIETGIATTSATTPSDPRAWFALYRYGADFLGTDPKLRFYEGVLDRDPRLTAVASEELAAGIACYILREHFGLCDIADALAFIDSGELRFVPGARSEERPDFFCGDLNGETVLAESKGATGTASKIMHRIHPEGWDQVQNVEPVNMPLRANCGRLVIGTHFCVQGKHGRSETTTVIRDPPGAQTQKIHSDSDALSRGAYAKVLRFMGQDFLAERLLGGRDLPGDFLERAKAGTPSLAGLPIWPLSPTPFGDAIGLFGPVAEALFQRSERPLRQALGDALKGLSDRQTELKEFGYALSNGVIVVHDPEEFL